MHACNVSLNSRSRIQDASESDRMEKPSVSDQYQLKFGRGAGLLYDTI